MRRTVQTDAPKITPSKANMSATVPAAANSPAEAVAPPAASDRAPTRPEANSSADTGALPAVNGPPPKSCIEQMISVFEFDSTSPKYDNIEDLDDGRGFTAGRSGFATKDGDLLEVVEVYDRMRPNNVLSGLVPILKKLQGTASTQGLEALPAAWKVAAADPLFRQVQDQVNDKLYYTPAMKVADKLYLQSPLTKLALYHAIIQHGVGDDSDSLGGIIRAATKTAEGPPNQVGEGKCLLAFLTARREVLLNARNRESRLESVGRVNEQLRLLKEGNLQLSAPLTLNPYGTELTVNCRAPSSAVMHNR